MANVVQFTTTAAHKEQVNFRKYNKKILAEKNKQAKLNKQATKLVDDYLKTHKKATDKEKLAYLRTTKVGKALMVAKKRERKFRQERSKYDRYKQDMVKAHYRQSLYNVKQKMNHHKVKTYNSYIMPNDARSDNSYVLLLVTNEGDDHSTNVATVPVEYGMNIQTATQMNNPTVSITAKIYGDNMSKVKRQVNRLTGWADSGAEMYFSGPHEHPHCTISDITATYNWDGDGSLTTADISMSLTLARYFETQETGKTGAKKKTGAKGRKRGRSSKNTNAKHYVIARAGTTYDYIAAKKHVSVQSLQEQNNYSARAIPIGSKIYY